MSYRRQHDSPERAMSHARNVKEEVKEKECPMGEGDTTRRAASCRGPANSPRALGDRNIKVVAPQFVRPPNFFVGSQIFPTISRKFNRT
jgi:dissimilatory sulfite reductase (desulfoviridin) alpha/beta subunit